MRPDSLVIGRYACLCLLLSIGPAACAVGPLTTPSPPFFDSVVVQPLATSPSSVAVMANAPTPTPTLPGFISDVGIQATLAAYATATGNDLAGSKTAAFTTLQDFTNPHGPYSRSWWFADDG